MSDIHVIACNFIEGTRYVSKNARAYIAHLGYDDWDRLHLIVKSRGGRWVQVWQPLHRLYNFRAKTLPEGHPARRAAIRLQFGDLVDRVELDRVHFYNERAALLRERRGGG